MTGAHKRIPGAWLCVRRHAGAIRLISINLYLLSHGVLRSWGQVGTKHRNFPKERVLRFLTRFPGDLCACVVPVRVGVLEHLSLNTVSGSSCRCESNFAHKTVAGEVQLQ